MMSIIAAKSFKLGAKAKMTGNVAFVRVKFGKNLQTNYNKRYLFINTQDSKLVGRCSYIILRKAFSFVTRISLRFTEVNLHAARLDG